MSLEDVAGFIPPPATDVYIPAPFPSLSALSLQPFSADTAFRPSVHFSTASLIPIAPQTMAASLTLVTFLLAAGGPGPLSPELSRVNRLLG